MPGTALLAAAARTVETPAAASHDTKAPSSTSTAVMIKGLGHDVAAMYRKAKARDAAVSGDLAAVLQFRRHISPVHDEGRRPAESAAEVQAERPRMPRSLG